MDVHVVTVVIFGVLGLVFGSFSGATVWRLRALQLKRDAKDGEKVEMADKRQVAKLQNKPAHKDRSVCLHCGHELKWYDLIPLFSWLSLGGKCRYCHKPIGLFEPLIELGLALFFVVSFLAWPLPLADAFEIARFAIWLIAGTGLAILFAYDAKWFLLPDVVTFPVIGLGCINAVLIIIHSPSPQLSALGVLGSCLVLSGLYYLIYVLSNKQWVGFGDVKLGLALGLLLADWRLALLALFLANLIGTIIILPFLLARKLNKGAHIPFGPLLIAGWAIAGLFGHKILSWYLMLALGL